MREHKYRARLKIKLGELPVGSWVYFCLQDAHFHDIIDWETCCDWTGLHDKNGTEIYESDYLKTDEAGWIGCVVWSMGGFIIMDDRGGFSGEPNWDKCEVIGNIYEDKELLK